MSTDFMWPNFSAEVLCMDTNATCQSGPQCLDHGELHLMSHNCQSTDHAMRSICTETMQEPCSSCFITGDNRQQGDPRAK